MNFLALVNRARRECGVSGADLPSIDSGLSQEGERFKNWIADAWRDIQLHKSDWEWMRGDVSFAVVQGQQTYTPAETGASDAADWKRDSFRCYSTAIGTDDEMILPFMTWSTFRDVYQFGTMRTLESRPVVMTVTPQRNLAIGPLPADGYTIVGEYFRKPTELTLDDDDPADDGLPDQFHMILVYRAMLAYAFYESAPEVEQRASRELRRMMQRLEAEYLPTITSGPPLA